MNEQLIAELIDIVNAEIRSFHNLLECMQEEQKALVEDDLEGIEASIAGQREAAVETHRLEARRIEVVAELAAQLEVEPGGATLMRLVEALGGPQGEELAHMRQTLLELNQKIRSTSESNAYLIRQSMRYTERCLDILTGPPVARGVYGQFGKTRREVEGRSLLNRTA